MAGRAAAASNQQTAWHLLPVCHGGPPFLPAPLLDWPSGHPLRTSREFIGPLGCPSKSKRGRGGGELEAVAATGCRLDVAAEGGVSAKMGRSWAEPLEEGWGGERGGARAGVWRFSSPAPGLGLGTHAVSRLPRHPQLYSLPRPIWTLGSRHPLRAPFWRLALGKTPRCQWHWRVGAS